MQMLRKIGFTIVSVTLLSPQALSATHCLKYMPAEVTVVGRVYEQTDWGPPNYGEDPAHDSRERHDYIHLDKPLCVAGSQYSDLNDIPERNVLIMELTWDTEKKLLANAVGRRVLLRGGLFHGFNGHHHTRVLLMVSHLELLGRTLSGN